MFSATHLGLPFLSPLFYPIWETLTPFYRGKTTINTLVGLDLADDNLPENEVQISVGLDLARHIAQDEYLENTTSPRIYFDIDEDISRDWYQQAIEKAYNITIEERGKVPPLDYNTLRNYEIGLDNLAELYDSVMTEYEIERNRYELYHMIMGDMTVIRTDSRVGIEASQEAYGYNEGTAFYDIFDTDRGSMSALNFTHELLHSFHKFSGMGNDHDEYSPMNGQWSRQDGNVVAEIDWTQRALANLDIVDTVLISADESYLH